MNVGMNADWARFKAHGIKCLGRRGFAEWLDHASKTMHAEANIEEAARRASDPPEPTPGASFAVIAGGR